MSQLLLIDKPKGWTSHDVVAKLRRVLHEKRIGHAGTLDPNATGLLIVGVGREETKKLGAIAKDTKKEYIATITLGQSRDTDDIEGVIVHENQTIKPTIEEVKKAIETFIGEQSQVPPAYSAIKMEGQKAYDMARAGKDVVMEPRTITVFEAECVEYTYPTIVVRFVVSSGTYIRALARDIGVTLKTFAFLSDLRRTRIGEYSVNDAQTLDTIESTGTISG
jgi:tRNA pseudouridine55 synthase